jgi:hypothetical protein
LTNKISLRKKKSAVKKKPQMSSNTIFTAVTGLCMLGLVLGVVLGTQLGSSSSVPVTKQPDSSVQITNDTSQNPLVISLQLDPTNPSSLWQIVNGQGTLSAAVFGDTSQNPPNYQLLRIPQNQTIIVSMPSFTNPWRITPQSKGVPTTEMPILVECNKSIVCDMSAVDGVNYLLRMELTASANTSTVIDFTTSPCLEPGKGCLNPDVNGLFAPGTNPASAPCPFGTCNLIGVSKAWADAIHTNQCANSSSTWPAGSFAPSCNTEPRSFTTYSYSHDDANSSPTLVAPYKLKLTYSDI